MKLEIPGPRMKVHHPIVGWDKDSTISDSSQRHHMLADCQAGRVSWAEYSVACKDDKPVASVIELMWMLSPSYLNVVMSGATECPEAMEWLEYHDVPADDVKYRPEGDYTENGLLKVRWIREYQAAGYDVAMYVEDWPETAETIRAATGVPVLVVNPCYPDELEVLREWRERVKGGSTI
jgi:hypothetical protein